MKKSDSDLWIVHNNWNGDVYVFATSAASAARKVTDWLIREVKKNYREAGEPYVAPDPVDRVQLVADRDDVLIDA